MESDLLRIVLLAGLLPGLIVGVGLVLVWGLLRGESDPEPTAPRRTRWAAPVLFFLGAFSIAGATGSLDASLLPGNIGGRALAGAAIALAFGLFDALAPGRALASLARVLGGALSAWIIVSPLHPGSLSAGDVALWCVLAGLRCAACVWLMEAPTHRRAWLAPTQAVVVVGALAALVYWSGQAPSSIRVGGFAGMLVAASVAAALLGRVSLARGGWTALAVLLVASIAMARALGELPPLAVGLVVCAVATGAFGRWLSERLRLGLGGAVLALALTGAPIAGGAWVAWSAYNAPGEPPDTDGDDDDGVYYTDDE